jgi:putative acetyltransferase
MIVEAENSSHHAAIRRILTEAFPSLAEANLVEQLRLDGSTRIALVATQESRIVGHVMFSEMRAPFRALGLAPVAVAADRRGRGIAAALISAGLERAKAGVWEAIFVLGDPAYYQRFGFRVDAASAFVSPFAGPHFMVLALTAAGLPVRSGRIDYAPAFSSLG